MILHSWGAAVQYGNNMYGWQACASAQYVGINHSRSVLLPNSQ